MRHGLQSLPIDPFLPEIGEKLKAHAAVVVSAAPGAGKTTRLPPELLKITDKAVWVLEPRRIAAISASQRIAEEQGCELGREVGYQVRFENRSSPNTRLLFLTEALLLRKLLQDPELKNVGCVVLDEFHERSLHVDLALGALKELQELSRPDLKIVVMSATLNAKPLAEYLNAPVVDVPGKVFPLDIRFETKAQLLRTGPEFTDRIKALIQKAARENPGNILCFLPGRGEIERLRSEFSDALPLHGQLSLQEQKAALAPTPGKRKIILATNVAESSLTVEGVSVVVDSGLARLSQVHPRTGFASLDLVRISKASAIQRSGRAARTGPGVVYRAWTAFDEQSMQEFEAAEIFRSDLSEALLLLSALGVPQWENFSWFEAPSARLLTQARDFLLALGAIDSSGKLTALGNELRQFPLHPRLAKLLWEGKKLNIRALACELAALLSEPGKRLAFSYEMENDLYLRWQEWKRLRNKSITKASDQLKALLGCQGEESTDDDWLLAPELLLAVYPDRLSRRRKVNESQGKMVGGRGVKLHPDSSVKTSEYFLALELSEGRDAAETLVFQAIGLANELVESLPTQPMERVEWDEEKKRFFVVENKEWQGLAIGSEHRRPAEANEVGEQLAALTFARWQWLLQEQPDLSQWWARLEVLHRLQPSLPLLTQEQIQEALSQACYGENSLEKVLAKDLVPFFENLLPEAQRAALQKECPASWVVPSGSRLRIQYTEEQGPQVEVRLQELFGLKAAPKVAGQALTLFLLAPNYRPVQVTRDLESFWKNGYPQVRKEMRARYPKHSWPEDPTTALPQAKGRARGALPPEMKA